jgi:hypothetical protein
VGFRKYGFKGTPLERFGSIATARRKTSQIPCDWTVCFCDGKLVAGLNLRAVWRCGCWTAGREEIDHECNRWTARGGACGCQLLSERTLDISTSPPATLAAALEAMMANRGRSTSLDRGGPQLLKVERERCPPTWVSIGVERLGLD